jgi:hypothetical protein
MLKGPFIFLSSAEKRIGKSWVLTRSGRQSVSTPAPIIMPHPPWELIASDVTGVSQME